MIRAAAIIQGLLGNVGRPGGGILALRGHSSIQGSTDIPTLYNMLPTYLPQPNAFKPHTTLKEYLDHERTPTGWWHNFPKYAVSLLKAWYGEPPEPDNEFGFGWVPRIVGDHSQLPMTLAMRDGVIRGMFMLGQNPAVGGHNAALVQRGLAELDWLVVRDMTETETASFWYAGRPVRDGEIKPRDIGTEVFLMPASLSAEKAGSVTNTHRLLQWHDKVVSGPGDSRSETWFIFHLGRRLKQLYAGSTDPEGCRARRIDLGLPDRRRGARAVGRCGAERDERLYLARSPPDREFSATQRRRHYRLRRLALLRRLSQGRRQSRPGPPPRRSGRSRHAFGLGVGLARQPAQYVQSRLGGRTGPPVVRAQAADVVGHRPAANGSAPMSSISSQRSRPTTSRIGARIPRAWRRSAGTARSS